VPHEREQYPFVGVVTHTLVEQSVAEVQVSPMSLGGGEDEPPSAWV